MTTSRRDLWLWLAAMAAVGCSDQSHYPTGTPIFPSGTTGGTSTPPPADAPASILDAGGGLIFGTVCQRTTVTPQACAALTGQGGLLIAVRETSTTTTLAADGTFMLPGAPGRSQVTIVTATDNPLWFGGAVSLALAADGGGRVTVPVLSQDDAATLVATNTGGQPGGTGFLVVHTGTGITVSDGASIVYYDTGDAPVLSPTPPTGASGTAVVFGALGTQTLSLVRDTTTVPATAEVFAGAATFLEAPF